jgi:hypothetical protein
MLDILPRPAVRVGARLLRRLKTCRTKRVIEGGRAFYWRRRTGGMAWLIKLANLVHRRTNTSVFILETGAWQVWEMQAHLQLNRLAVAPRGRGLLVPTLSGSPLAELLSTPSLGPEDKLRALKLAVTALREAHQERIQTAQCPDQPFTHGDATCSNVLVALETAQAAWIDFETRHDGTSGLTFRRADDLRALLMSALEWLGPEAFPAVWQLTVRAYPEPAVLSALADALNVRSRPMYHWAQGLFWLRQPVRYDGGATRDPLPSGTR